MQSDFELSCKDARAAIEVPGIQLDDIRSRATAKPAHTRKLSVVTGAIVCCSMAAIAAAAVLGGAKLTFVKGGGIVLTTSGTMETHWRATPADVRTAVAHADFHVTLPGRLPHGTTLRSVTTVSAGIILLQYALPGNSRASHRVMDVILANPDAVHGTPGAQNAYGPKHSKSRAEHWRIGSEEVFIETAGLTRSEVAAIKSAMTKAAPP